MFQHTILLIFTACDITDICDMRDGVVRGSNTYMGFSSADGSLFDFFSFRAIAVFPAHPHLSTYLLGPIRCHVTDENTNWTTSRIVMRALESTDAQFSDDLDFPSGEFGDIFIIIQVAGAHK